MIILTIRNPLPQNQNVEVHQAENSQASAITIRTQNREKTKTEKNTFLQNLERRSGVVVPDQQ